jgi:hypothetical protein
VLTFLGSIVFCAAVIGTIQSLLDGGAGNGPAIGGIIIGFGLAMLIIPWLPDDAARAQSTQSESRRMAAA